LGEPLERPLPHALEEQSARLSISDFLSRGWQRARLIVNLFTLPKKRDAGLPLAVALAILGLMSLVPAWLTPTFVCTLGVWWAYVAQLIKIRDKLLSQTARAEPALKNGGPHGDPR